MGTSMLSKNFQSWEAQITFRSDEPERQPWTSLKVNPLLQMRGCSGSLVGSLLLPCGFLLLAYLALECLWRLRLLPLSLAYFSVIKVGLEICRLRLSLQSIFANAPISTSTHLLSSSQCQVCICLCSTLAFFFCSSDLLFLPPIFLTIQVILSNLRSIQFFKRGRLMLLPWRKWMDSGSASRSIILTVIQIKQQVRRRQNDKGNNGVGGLCLEDVKFG